MSGVTQANVNLDPNFDAQEEQDRWEELARKAKRFRILIIGRTNAGKTTILKKFCDSTDEPEIYNSKGEKIDRSTIEPTTKRGIHDINNEMIFQSNPGFIFHDSRGFEAGGSDELQKVKKFMFQQSLSGKLVDQVHVIWYCIPLDDSRPFQYAEKQFFSEVGTGKVPIVVVFTKCEALEHEAVNVLEEQGYSFKDAVKGSADYAKKHLQTAHLKLQNYKYQPQGYVYLQEMDKPNTSCKTLAECTADVLNSSNLQAIFVSTQQVSIELSVCYAMRSAIRQFLKKDMIERAMSNNTGYFLWSMLKITMEHFPYWAIYLEQQDQDQLLYVKYKDHLKYKLAKSLPTNITPIYRALIQLATNYSSFSPQHQVIHLCSAFAIIAEHLYIICNKTERIKIDYISSSITLFYQSPVCAAVTAQIEEASTIYSTSIAEFHSSTWLKVTSSLPGSQARKEKNEIEDALMERLYDIVLDNRLDKTRL